MPNREEFSEEDLAEALRELDRPMAYEPLRVEWDVPVQAVAPPVAPRVAFTTLDEARPRRLGRPQTGNAIQQSLNRACNYAIEGIRVPTPPEGIVVTRINYTQEQDYAVAASRAWMFFRQSGSRYSDRTLMQVARIQDALEAGLLDMPFFVTVSAPTSYDEVTEVKYGGMIGMRITWPDNKTILCVHPTMRRKGIGTLLLDPIYGETGLVWTGGSNIPGQVFLLTRGFRPQSMSRTGSISFTRPSEFIEDEEDYG